MRRFFTLLCVQFLCLTGKSSGQDASPWILKANNINPANYYGITVANGIIGIVSSPEPFKVKNVVFAGAYDLYGRGRVSNFLNGFNLLNMYLEIDGHRINNQNVSNFKQELDMQHACFTTTFDYADKATITCTYYSLRQLPFTVLENVSVTAKKDIHITAASVMEAPDELKEVQNYYNEIDRPHTSIQLLTSTAKSPTGKLQISASTTFLFTEEHGKEPRVLHEMWDNNMHSAKFNKNVSSGQTYQFAIAGSSVTSSHHPDPLNEAERLTIFAKLEGTNRLIKFHENAWADLWKSDIAIDGDKQVQQDIHSMLYHLYSFSRAGTAYAPSPMGLSGLGYNGHVFWDSDLWMFPALLVLHPEIARSLIDYRFNRLNEARQNAFAHGYKGAMFPWESADTGVEETPVWALSGPFEHHITACVALAAWQYYCVTGDKQWLREKGWPILSATADFWVSRVEQNGPGHFDIKNVVAADEWAENIDNDAFTNAAAQVNLQNAVNTAKILDIKPDSNWAIVAGNIPILAFSDGVTKEHAAYKGEGIKQADVNLLAYPLKTITNTEQIKKDLAYYEKRVPTEGTPAMTEAIFALLYARFGDGEKAYHFFKGAYDLNLLPPFRVIAETKGGTNPYFATGAGGLIQSVLMGFGGLDITGQGIIQLKSTLPAKWKSLTITGVGINKQTYTVK
ncbi:glycoside hydrolase family 65 protein [Mucilaginibacter sp.]|uniref:glycoside hydrolase family 65 protein n=1 Tax=Mucilaginibacter sp. TaxID=1882438 RepID=UPI00261750B8|nr:glycoside hydrolase family 65 protein [Mucilaginibacter sp.]MDB5032720.1 glycosyl hydrolase family 65 [Mucilaginibacter sp.]